jgi:hypothetical protein
MGRAPLWAIFLQTHPVTLSVMKENPLVFLLHLKNE